MPAGLIGEEGGGVGDDDGVLEVAEGGFDDGGVIEVGGDEVGEDACDVGEALAFFAGFEDAADGFGDAFAFGLEVVEDGLAGFEGGAVFALAGEILGDGGHFLVVGLLVGADLGGVFLEAHGALGEVGFAGFEFGDFGLEFGDLGVDLAFAGFEAGLLVGEVFLIDLQAVDVVVEAGDLAHEVDGFALVFIDAAVEAGDGFGGLLLAEDGFGDFGFVVAEFLIDGGEGFLVCLHVGLAGGEAAGHFGLAGGEEFALFGELADLLAGEIAALLEGGLVILGGEEFALGLAGGLLGGFEFHLQVGLAVTPGFHVAADGGEVIDDVIELLVEDDDFFVEALVFLHDVGGTEFLEAGGVFLIAAGAAGLDFDGAELLLDFLEDELALGEVLVGLLEFAEGFFFALFEAGDAGGFLEDFAAVVGVGFEEGRDAALFDEGVGVDADAGVEEELADVLEAGGLVVDEVFGGGVAVEAAGDLDGGGVHRQATVLVGEGEGDFGHAHGFAGGGAVEDDVEHGVAAEGFGGHFAEDPLDGIDDVGLAAAVGADDGGDAVIEEEFGVIGEGFEAGEFEFSEFHLR